VSATPFFVGSKGCRIDTLGVEAVGSSPQFVTLSVRVGIYDNAPFGAGSIYPRNLLASGQIDYAPAFPPEIGLKRTAIGLDLTEGLYWLACVVLPPTNMKAWAAPVPDDRHPEVPFMGTGSGVAGGGVAFSYYVLSQPTLPLTYPSGALVANSSTQSERAPSIFLEIS